MRGRRWAIQGLVRLAATSAWAAGPWARALGQVAPPPGLQAWPTRPLTLVTASQADQGTDGLAQLLANELTQQLGQPVVVDRRSGAGGKLAAWFAARAAPDGHTYFLGAVHDLFAAVGYSKLGFDLDHDLLPIAEVARLPLAVVINANELAAPDFVALLKYLRKHRGVRFTSAGVGTPGHFAGEQFAVYARTSFEHVAAQSASMALEDLLAGKADLMFEALGVAAPYLRTGALRALAVAGSERLSAYPQIPTLTEFGWLADLPSYSYGLWAVGAAPADINARMTKALAQALAQPSLRLALAHFGAEPSVQSDDDFKTKIRRQINHWFDVGGMRTGLAK